MPSRVVRRLLRACLISLSQRLRNNSNSSGNNQSTSNSVFVTYRPDAPLQASVGFRVDITTDSFSINGQARRFPC